MKCWVVEQEDDRHKHEKMKIYGLVKEDACDWTKWRSIVKLMTIQFPANSVEGEEPGSKLHWWWWIDPIHVPEKHFKEITFPRKTLGRNHIIPNVHLPEWALASNYISLYIHMPVIRLARRLIWQILHSPEFIFGRNYISTKIYFPKFTFSRKFIFQILHLPEFTSDRNYISLKTYFPYTRTSHFIS